MTTLSLYSISSRRFVETDTNLKSAALTIFELLALNAQKFTGSRDLDVAPVLTFFRDHVGTVLWSMRVKFEVCSFSV